MADWTFEKALAAIKSPSSISLDTLVSLAGLHLGDIRFAKIQTNLRMRTVAMALLEEWILNQSFNPHHKPDEDCSHTTAIATVCIRRFVCIFAKRMSPRWSPARPLSRFVCYYFSLSGAANIQCPGTWVQGVCGMLYRRRPMPYRQ